MPKIDRVILALTANPTYTGFLNYVADIWRNKFHIEPTVIFCGTQDELSAFMLSRPSTDVFYVERVPGVTVNPARDWACTWGLFYGATLFPRDVCMTVGIDQVPLNGAIFDVIKPLPRDKFIVGFADAYVNPGNPAWNSPRAASIVYPSTHLLGLGLKWQQVFDIDIDWKPEVEKVFATRQRYDIAPDVWGLDEAYSSDILRQRVRSGADDVLLLETFNTLYQPNRLWRGKNKPAELDFEGIAQGKYTEWHADRPFEVNDPAILARIKQSISVYNW